MDDLDPRAGYASEQLAGSIASGNPDGTGGHLEPLASAWLPSRSLASADQHDVGLAFLVLIATPIRNSVERPLTAPYFVAIARRGADLKPWQSTRWSDLSAIEEVPTLAGALATFAARLTGITVEALADGHGL